MNVIIAQYENDINKKNLFISVYSLYKPGADIVWSQSRFAIKKQFPTAKSNFRITQNLYYVS